MARYDNVDAILSPVDVLQYEPLAQSIGRPILQIDHIITNAVRLLQYIPEKSRLQYWRKFSVQGNYQVTNESIRFFLAVKPWRLSALHHPNKSIVLHKIDKLVRELQCKKITSVSFALLALQELTSDTQLASLVCSLTYLFEPVAFFPLHHILKRLTNITELRANLSQYEMVITTEQICHALNQLPHLRRAWIKTAECFNSVPPILLSKLRYGRIVLEIPETLTMAATTEFAYRSLYLMLFYGTTRSYAAQWTKLVQQSASIAHLTIIISLEQLDLPTIIPQNLTSLTLVYTRIVEIHPLTMRQQNILKRLNLRCAQIQWPALVVWCPHICVLKIDGVAVYGSISGLRLVTLMFIRSSSQLKPVGGGFNYAAVRHMCAGTLTHLTIRVNVLAYLKSVLCDWKANPDFLVGSRVRYAYGRRDFQVWSAKYRERVILLASKALC